MWLFIATPTASKQLFFPTLREKHDVTDAVGLVDYTRYHTAVRRRARLRFRTARQEDLIAIIYLITMI